MLGLRGANKGLAQQDEQRFHQRLVTVTPLQELADRVAVLSDGRIVACDSPRNIADRRLAPSRVSFDLSAADGTREMPLVEDAALQRCRERVTIATREPEAQLRALLAWADHRKMRLSTLAVTPPSLEDVYLSLVGPAGEEVT